MARDWLADRRGDVAADRILDAADGLFTRHDAATVGMSEIAAAAGCSRATVYRYFDGRDALYAAYVHREARRVFGRIGEQLAGVDDPHDRLCAGILAALRSVRQSPSLSSWFAPAQRPIGGEMGGRSDVVTELTEAFLRSLDVDRAPSRARWLVRVMISLLTFPGSDDAEERAMLEEFVLPAMLSPR